MTNQCTTVKFLTSECKIWLIDIGEILDAELDDSEPNYYKVIIFCDKDNVICIYK